MAGGISFDGEDTQQPVQAQVGLDDTSGRKIPDNVAARQAVKADYGLGPDSPGKDTIANSISSGSEDSLRGTAAAAQEMKETAAAAKRLLGQTTKTGPITQDDVDLTRGSMVKPVIDPGVVFELGYGRKIVNDLATQNPDSSSVFNRATSADPADTYKHMDAASEIIAKQGIVDRLLENRKADWAATSWWDATPDLVESVVPLLSASRMRNVVGVDGSLLPGNNLEDQVQGLLLMPPSQFKQKLEEVTDELYNKNPLDAIRFMEAVKSYGSEDKYLDNLFGIADAVGVGEGTVGLAKTAGKLTGSAAKAAAKLPAEAAADVASRQARKALKDAVKASAKDPMMPEDIFAAAGQVEKAADLTALRRVGVLPDVGLTDAEILTRNLPSVARVDRIVADAGSLTREAADRLASKLKASIGGSDEALGLTVRNTRLNPQQLEIAVEETKASLRREFEKSTDSIIDIRHNNVEGNVSNVETVTIELGAPRATPLPTEDLARHYAEDIYGLPEEAYKIAQKGDSFTIEVTKQLDETTPAVRAAIVTNNPEPTEGVTGFMDFLRQPNRILPGFLKSADESLVDFQNAQRKAVQFGFNRTIGELKDMIQPIAALSRAEKRDLEKVLSYNRDFFNVKTGDRGFFYESIADLEEGFQRSVGRLPTEGEIEAYFRYTQLSDLDWGFRNFSLYRDKARLGLKQYSVEFMKVDEGGTAFPRTPPFDGKKVDNLPWNGEPATVLHFKNGGKDAEVFNTKAVNNVEYEDMIKNQGYTVIQVDNPVQRPFRDVLNNNEVIQYVLTKELKEHPLPLKQLDYNPGGHVEYQHDWFLKQPRISVGRGGQKFYEGDSAVLNFTSEAQTRRFEKAINEARLALKAGDEATLDKILGKRLPWTKDEFKNLFTGDEALSLDEKFHVIKRGRSSIQEVKAIRDENPGIRDYTDSAHNLSGEANRKFVGARNGPLMTVHASGSDSNPMLRLAPAKLIDPLQTMGRSLSNAANNRFFGDYKAGAIEDFIARHSGAMKTNNRDLQNFPMYYLHNPEWDESKSAYGAVMAAKNDRRAIMNFVGEQSTLGRVVENTKQRIYNSIFNTFGEDATTKVVNWTSNKSGENIDPAGYFRAVAFHTKLGLFNPLQYPLQAMGATHAIALSPKHGLNAAISYFPTRWLGLHPSDELIKDASQKMKAFGWKPEHFEESIKSMRQVGYDKVGAEHAWKDNIADPQMFGDPGSSFLDKGTFFFNEGERTNRIISWHTAYREWREANPLKTLDANELRTVLNRADLFGLNMTRASAASWQKGLLSIPTQFLSYNARMMDQFLGKRLTPMEKTRAFAMYSAMYGIPAAASGVTGYTFYDDIRKTALEKGWDTNDTMFKALHEGLLSSMVSLATGTDYNVASRYGPGGMKPLKELMTGDKALTELIGGASGSIVGDILSSAEPLIKDSYEVFKNGGSYEPVLQDIIDASRNISSVNNGFKVLHALNTGKYITKNGKSQGDLTGAQAILGGLTGLQPQELTDMSIKQASMAGSKEHEDEVFKEWSKQFHYGQLAAQRGDKEGAAANYKKARAALIAGDINQAKMGLYMQRYLKQHGDTIDSVDNAFVQGAPNSQFGARNEARKQRLNN